MDNLPKDPPDNNPPPPFGSNFNSNPSIPPNSPQSPDPIIEAHRETAEHQPRDAHGRFIPEHPDSNPAPQTTPTSQTTPTPSNIPNPPTTPNPPNIPPPIQITQDQKPNDSTPLVDIKVTNPLTYITRFIKKILKNEGITLKIKPLTAIAIVLALSGGSFSIGSYLFPHSSPLLHRQVMYQGQLQKTDKGFFLTLPNSDLYTLKPKPKTNINFTNLKDGPALVKGNLTREKFVIEVSEIIPLGSTSQSESPTTPASPASLRGESAPLTSQTSLTTPNLPPLYPNLSWEVTQTKTLLFTSGKRRIEQEGVYLESSEVKDYPQDFINYYTNELTASGFKQTFKQSEPQGTTLTFAKEDLFLTFGVKNIYSGSGDNKKLVGYKAFIEHN